MVGQKGEIDLIVVDPIKKVAWMYELKYARNTTFSLRKHDKKVVFRAIF